MHSKILISKLAFFTLILIFSYFTNVSAQEMVVFQVDMNGVDVPKDTIIGIRGNTPPLAWTKSLKMSDPDGDGIYSINIVFNSSKPGDRIQYKYTLGSFWDLDRYHKFGNRIVTLSKCPNIIKADKWDNLERIAMEPIMEMMRDYEVGNWVYTISQGKKKGLTTEQSIEEFFTFWQDSFNWLNSPSQFLADEKIGQARFLNGYFEIIEESPEKVIYKIGNPKKSIMYNWIQDKDLFGVSAEDIGKIDKVYVEHVCEVKSWKVNFKTEKNFTIVTILSK